MNFVDAKQEVTNARAVTIFAGGRSAIGDEGTQSGIRKRLVAKPIEVTHLGLVGDAIVDLRHHGGPDKAVNLFPQEHYVLLCALFPHPDEPFAPGGFGENISCAGLHEDSVRIGDTYKIGSTIMQVSQPRSPCWKLNARFGIEKFSLVVQEKRITGWYARVLEEGTIRAGDEIRLIGRDEKSCAITEFWDCVLASKPDVKRLKQLSALSSLSVNWRHGLSQRVLQLKEH